MKIYRMSSFISVYGSDCCKAVTSSTLRSSTCVYRGVTIHKIQGLMLLLYYIYHPVYFLYLQQTNKSENLFLILIFLLNFCVSGR